MSTHQTTTSADQAELTELRELLELPGPWATVELPAPSGRHDAPGRFEREWTNAARELGSAGAPTTTIDRLAEAVRRCDHVAGASIIGYANDSGTIRVIGLPAALRDRRATYAPLPRLLTEIDWRRRAVNHLIVLLDRTGADITAGRWGDDPTVTTEIDGSHDVVRKTSAGGWSQQRFQQRAEDSWERNAEEIADAVATVADDTRSELIIAAGGPRMVPLVRDALPAHLAARLTEIDGGRADGVDLEAMADDVERALADHAARGLAATLRELDERGVDGVDTVLAALSRAEVSTLLVDDDVDDHRTAWFVRDGFSAAATPDELAGLGSDPVEGRLVDVAARSAMLSGAAIVVGPANRGRELAALLRTD